MEQQLKRLVKAERTKSIVKLLKQCPGLEMGYLDRKRKQTALHWAARKGKGGSLGCLLREGYLDAVRCPDLQGNIPLHLALVFALKEEEHVVTLEEINEELVLPLLRAAPDVLDVKNANDLSVRELLAAFDTLLAEDQSRKRKRPRPSTNELGRSTSEHDTWLGKLFAAAEDEYASSWGKFEDDCDWDDPACPETYDEWAERIIHERAKKRRPPSPERKKKPVWSEEAQKEFLEAEKLKHKQKDSEKSEKKRRRFYAKLQERESVEFILDYETGELERLILSELEMLAGDDRQKAYKELRRFWHPDKFLQKYASRVSEEKRSRVLRVVTGLSQTVNTFVC